MYALTLGPWPLCLCIYISQSVKSLVHMLQLRTTCTYVHITGTEIVEVLVRFGWVFSDHLLRTKHMLQLKWQTWQKRNVHVIVVTWAWLICLICIIQMYTSVHLDVSLESYYFELFDLPLDVPLKFNTACRECLSKKTKVMRY